MPEEEQDWSLRTLREKLVGARAALNCYAVFQLAEVAVSRALFAEMLRQIDRLRPKPLGARAGLRR